MPRHESCFGHSDACPRCGRKHRRIRPTETEAEVILRIHEPCRQPEYIPQVCTRIYGNTGFMFGRGPAPGQSRLYEGLCALERMGA